MYVPIGCGSLTILYLDKRYLKPFNSYEIFKIEFLMFFDKVIILLAVFMAWPVCHYILHIQYDFR